MKKVRVCSIIILLVGIFPTGMEVNGDESVNLSITDNYFNGTTLEINGQNGVVIEGNEFYNISGKFEKVISIINSSDIIIRNNFIHDFSAWNDYHIFAIYIYNSDNITISQNVIQTDSDGYLHVIHVENSVNVRIEKNTISNISSDTLSVFEFNNDMSLSLSNNVIENITSTSDDLFREDSYILNANNLEDLTIEYNGFSDLNVDYGINIIKTNDITLQGNSLADDLQYSLRILSSVKILIGGNEIALVIIEECSQVEIRANIFLNKITMIGLRHLGFHSNSANTQVNASDVFIMISNYNVSSTNNTVGVNSIFHHLQSLSSDTLFIGDSGIERIDVWKLSSIENVSYSIDLTIESFRYIVKTLEKTETITTTVVDGEHTKVERDREVVTYVSETNVTDYNKYTMEAGMAENGETFSFDVDTSVEFPTILTYFITMEFGDSNTIIKQFTVTIIPDQVTTEEIVETGFPYMIILYLIIPVVVLIVLRTNKAKKILKKFLK